MDIINLINEALNCDVVYVCNSYGQIDGVTMFILGFLMAFKQEIFLWNKIVDSEWLMASLCQKNNIGYKEIIQFPLDFIRSMAFPYLFKKEKIKVTSNLFSMGQTLIDENGNLGIERNTEFNLNVKEQLIKPNTVTLLGSLTKQISSIRKVALQFKQMDIEVLAPKISDVKNNINGFIIFNDDISNDPIVIESNFIEDCLKSEFIYVCNEDGYIGNTVLFELGYLIAKQKEIIFMNEPQIYWLKDVINYFKKGEKNARKIIK